MPQLRIILKILSTIFSSKYFGFLKNFWFRKHDLVVGDSWFIKPKLSNVLTSIEIVEITAKTIEIKSDFTDEFKSKNLEINNCTFVNRYKISDIEFVEKVG